MAIINQRWPSDLMPETCAFGPSRNDAALVAPYTRQTTVIKRGRPLWTAKCAWRFPNSDKLAKLRYWLEALDGFSGSVQVWDFSSPYPAGVTLGVSTTPRQLFWTNTGTNYVFTSGALPYQWTAGNSVPAAAGAAIGATSVNVSGLTPSTLACLLGQYIQVGRRLYISAASVTSDGSGNATLQLLRPLISAVVAGDPVYVVQAACEMRMANQDWSNSTTAGDGTTTVSAEFIETVQDYT